MSKRSTLMVWVVCLFVGSSLPAWANPMCLDRPISLAFYEHGRLYDAGRDAGIDKDVVEWMVAKSGCRFDLSVMARARIWADLAEGNLDITTSGIQTPERDSFAAFAHYLRIKNHFIFRNLSEKYDDLDKLGNDPGVKYAVVRSYRYEPPIDAFLKTIQPADRVIEVQNVEVAYHFLADYRADVIISQPVVFVHYVEELQLGNQIHMQDLIPEAAGAPHGMIFSRKNFSAAQLVMWQNLVNGMVKDGTIHKILTKHLPKELVGPSSFKG